MTILQRVEFIWPDGAAQVGFRVWADSLPSNDRQECFDAILRQENLRYSSVNSGYMTITANGFLWKDQASYDAGHILDETWVKYMERYQTETGVQRISTNEEQ